MSRLLGILLLGALAAGCGKAVCDATGITVDDPPQGPPISGQPVSLGLHVDVSSACMKASEVKVSAILHDPNGAEVPVHLSQQSQEVDGRTHVDATLSFTPQTGGNYHLDGQFTSDGKPFTRNLLVITGADGATPVLQTLPRPCASLARTVKGALVCDGVVFRATTEEQTLDGGVAVAGDSVWTYADGTLSAYADPGSGPLTALGEIAASDGGAALLAAGPRDAYVIWDAQVQHFALTDAGVVAAGAVGVLFGPDAGPARAASYANGFALVAADAPDAGSYVCEVDSADGGLSAGACTATTHAVLGGDGRGIWLADPAKITTQRSPPTQMDGLANLYLITGGSGPQLRGSVVFPDGLAATNAGGSAWVQSGLYGLDLVPTASSSSLALQQFVPSTQDPVVGVSDELVWTQPAGDSRTAVFLRP